MTSQAKPFWANRPVKNDSPTEPSAPATSADGPLPLDSHVRLLVLDGPVAGASFVVHGGRCTIGTDPSCDVVITDASVSRRHAQCELFGRAVRVIDLESQGGINYLGHSVREAVVPYGATLRIGQTRFCFERETEGSRATVSELAGLVGESQLMRRVFFVLQRLSALDSSVLLLGMSGTGKTAAARAIHALSSRGAEPCVVLDGATADIAAFDAAAVNAGKGTLIVAHVGELTPTVQRRLLTELDTHHLACRLLATSGDDLTDGVNQGSFDKTLYRWLTADVVELPPLEQRREDIEPLARRFAASLGGTLEAEVLGDLRRRSYPGNVRELERDVAAMFRKRAPQVSGRGYNELRDEAVQSFEARYLAELLARHQGNVSAAAREAQLSRSQFYRVLRRHPSLMDSVRAE